MKIINWISWQRADRWAGRRTLWHAVSAVRRGKVYVTACGLERDSESQNYHITAAEDLPDKGRTCLNCRSVIGLIVGLK